MALAWRWLLLGESSAASSTELGSAGTQVKMGAVERARVLLARDSAESRRGLEAADLI